MRFLLSDSSAMGVLCAPIGALTALLVLANTTGSGYESLLVAAPIAAFVAGKSSWWLLVSRKARTGLPRGVLAGALAGAVGHSICWYMLLVGAFACHVTTGGCTDSLGQPPMNPLHAFAAAAGYSAFSLVFYGWLTVPAGALLGGLLAVARRRAAGVQPPDPSSPRTPPG